MNNTLNNICNKLGVNVAEMRIIDSKTTSNGELVMVFPVENCSDELARVKGVRGSVWKMEGGDVVPVYGTLGYADEYVADHIGLHYNMATGKNSVVLTNYHTGTSVILEVGITHISMCNEGLVYRVTKDFMMNHRKFDARDSTWGEAKYSTIFDMLGLPNPEVLFDGRPDDICHVFMAVHRHTITGTRQVFRGDAGYIVYLGAVDEHNNRVPSKDYPFPHMEYNEFPNEVTENLGVIRPVLFTLDEANDFLDCGFYSKVTTNDPRLKPGESIIIHTMSGDRIKVVSSGFHWRNSLREGSTSVVNQYYNLVHGVWDEIEYKDRYGRSVRSKNGKAKTIKVWNKDAFKAKFLPIDPDSVKNIKDFITNGNFYVYADETSPFTEEQLKRYETDVYERARVVYFNYLLSLPVSSQREYIGLYDQYVSDTDNLVRFIQMSRKGMFVYVDPRTLPIVGSAKQSPAEVEELLKCVFHRKGCDNRIYNIRSALDGLNGKELVLLKEPHPRIGSLVEAATNEAKWQCKGFRNVSDVKMEEMITSNIRSLLTRENFNTKFQMAKQAHAWIKDSRPDNHDDKQPRDNVKQPQDSVRNNHNSNNPQDSKKQTSPVNEVKQGNQAKVTTNQSKPTLFKDVVTSTPKNQSKVNAHTTPSNQPKDTSAVPKNNQTKPTLSKGAKSSTTKRVNKRPNQAQRQIQSISQGIRVQPKTEELEELM